MHLVGLVLHSHSGVGLANKNAVMKALKRKLGIQAFVGLFWL